MAKTKEFSSLSEFLAMTDVIETKAITKAVKEERAKIANSFNSTSVELNVLHSKAQGSEVEVPDLLNKGIEAEAAFADYTKETQSAIEEILNNSNIKDERRTYWINHLSDLFNIDPALTEDERIILIDQTLIKNESMLSYVTYIIEDKRS